MVRNKIKIEKKYEESMILSNLKLIDKSHEISYWSTLSFTFFDEKLSQRFNTITICVTNRTI